MAGLLIALLWLGLVCSDRIHFNGDVVLTVAPKTNDQLEWFQNWIQTTSKQIDIWREIDKLGKKCDVHIKANDVESVKTLLKSKSIEFIVKIRDLEKLVRHEEIENSNHGFSQSFSYDRFNSYSAILSQLHVLANRHDVEEFSIGSTFMGKEIKGIKITSGDGRQKPGIWVDGGIHAREWISPATVMYLAKFLTDKGIFSNDAAKVLKKYDIYIVPVVNVDGYDYTRSTDRMWRKTRSSCHASSTHWRQCCGTDPNRNWGSHWGGPGASSSSCKDNYRGPHAFSEKCVRAVAQKLKAIKEQSGLVSYWNVHAYSELLLTPYGYTKRYPLDYEEIERVGKIFQNGVYESSGKRFTVGSPANILYTASGGSMDWTYDNLGVKYSYGPELRPSRQTFGNGFIVRNYEIKPSGHEFTNGFLKAVLAMRYP